MHVWASIDDEVARLRTMNDGTVDSVPDDVRRVGEHTDAIFMQIEDEIDVTRRQRAPPLPRGIETAQVPELFDVSRQRRTGLVGERLHDLRAVRCIMRQPNCHCEAGYDEHRTMVGRGSISR